MISARSAAEKRRCEKMMKSIPHYKCNKCHHCGKHTPQGCTLCEDYLHIKASCWNRYHEREVIGEEEKCKHPSTHPNHGMLKKRSRSDWEESHSSTINNDKVTDRVMI